MKGASFAPTSEASDLELVPTRVTVWVRSDAVEKAMGRRRRHQKPTLQSCARAHTMKDKRQASERHSLEYLTA